ncbi:transcription termination factor Rho [Luteolibacter algae]|uniref:Transcription termination factor Rho n=1 Tax=Luteolibacter algae TaxID=454151 RepID=A0ABW5DAE9_9BACT
MPAPTAQAPQPASIPAPAPLQAPKPIELSPPPAPAAPAPQAREARQDELRQQNPPRIGRVPGGGPVNQQENRAQGSPEGQEQRESRSKKRREKRKRRRDNFSDNNQNQDARNNRRESPRPERQQEDRSPTVLTGEKIEADGIIEMTPKGFGFLRLADSNFEQAKEDIFISPELIRRHSLRHGQWLHGFHQSSNRGPQLVEISQVNGMLPDEAAILPHFDELKAVNPNKRISFETTPDRYTTRVVDIVAPVGRGQRGLIVSPPRSGKTTLLLHMAEAIREKYDEQIHLMILLVDERPEEVTEFRRALPGAEIYASSNDEQARNHCRIAELAIERAKRLVEAGKDVFLLMDSITRLARAYNGNMGMGKGNKGRGRATGSGGITIGALEVPRRLFAAARNTREAGSLTILATALIQTNSRADEAIFMEFKGTGNMELVLDRKIAESYIYPAVDIFKSGTRREELLLPEHTLHKIHLIRRGLSGHRPYEAMERLLYFIKKFPNNPQMLLEIKG